MNDGERRRNQGMDKAKAQAPPELIAQMWNIWKQLCQKYTELTTDDFWTTLSPELHDQVSQHFNTVGAMARESANYGWVRTTPYSIKTLRTPGNARKITIWKSRICGPTATVASSIQHDRSKNRSLFDE